jgi:hypothetical protein
VQILIFLLSSFILKESSTLVFLDSAIMAYLLSAFWYVTYLVEEVLDSIVQMK